LFEIDVERAPSVRHESRVQVRHAIGAGLSEILCARLVSRTGAGEALAVQDRELP